MACLSLSLLGPFEVRLDEQPADGFVSNKARALLAYLAVESAHPHRRDSLAALLWPDWPDASARGNLRNALANLRAVVGDRTAIGDRTGERPYLLTSRETIQFNPDSDHWLDVVAFRTAIEATSVGSRELEEALDLYRGPFLEGFIIGDSAAYEEWALRVREELERLALNALERLAIEYEASSEIERAIAAARRQVALAPWQESAHRRLMRLLALDGQRSAALSQYETCRRLLAQELSVEPSAETVRLLREIREGRAGPKEPEGESRPRRHAARPQEPPPQATPRHNLPSQATPFIGREAQLAEINERLARPEVRLLTLTGVGGTGKTRLALQVAAQVTHYRDGVYWVPLAALRDPALVVPAVAAALGVRESGDTPLLGACKNVLRERERLLVLDNFEQVMDAAAAVGELLAAAPRVQVLATSRVPLHVYGEYEYPVPPMEVPHPQLLAQGKGAGPPLEQFARAEAVSLFVHCAQRAQPDFALDEGNAPAVSEICARLDGLPLAIELAAARVKLFSPSAMLAHLGGARGPPPGSLSLHFLTGGPRNAPARQRTLRAAIEWSDSLLDANEQRLFRRLSVFAGGFTLQAVEAVCVDPVASVPRPSPLDLLESLLDQSLLLEVSHSSPPRFAMLETVREYAWERLQESGEAETVRDRHTDHFCGALHAWGADLKGSRQLEALHEIEVDLDNVRAAWEWAVGAHEHVREDAQADWQDRALDGLCLFYEWRGRYEEGKTACQKVVDRWTARRPAVDDLEEPGLDLASAPESAPVETGYSGPAPQDTPPESPGLPEDDVRLRVMARALAWQSRLNRTLGQLEFADRCFARALALLGQHASSGHDAQRAFVLLCMAERASETDLEKARRLAERSLALYRALGDQWGMARALLHLGSVANLLGEYGEMSKLLQEGLALSQKLGDPRGSLWSLLGLGFSAVHIGQLEEGERLARQAIADARGLGDMELVRSAAIVLSTALHDRGRFAEARAVREEDLIICRDHGMVEEETAAMAALGVTARHCGDYDEARLLTREALALGLASGERRSTARCTMELGCLALAEGAVEEAEDWLRQCLALYAELGRHWLAGELWSALAYLACSQSGQAQARGHLLAALRIAAESKYRNGILQSLPAMALLLLDQGGRGSSDAERAVELYALASRYPYVANSRWFEDVAGREIAAAAEALPPDVVVRAQERGRARDLWATVEELLDEPGGD